MVIITSILALFVSMVSEIMIKSLGIGLMFLFYGLISLLCLLFLYGKMIESKGLSRQELIRRIESNNVVNFLENEERQYLHEEDNATTAEI